MISPELKSTILSAIHLDDWEIDDDTVASQVPGWDSLTHISVIAAVEARFGVRFSISDVVAMKKIGDLQRLLDSRMQGKRR